MKVRWFVVWALAQTSFILALAEITIGRTSTARMNEWIWLAIGVFSTSAFTLTVHYFLGKMNSIPKLKPGEKGVVIGRYERPFSVDWGFAPDCEKPLLILTGERNNKEMKLALLLKADYGDTDSLNKGDEVAYHKATETEAFVERILKPQQPTPV